LTISAKFLPYYPAPDQAPAPEQDILIWLWLRPEPDILLRLRPEQEILLRYTTQKLFGEK
jgi:hypothetical protein